MLQRDYIRNLAVSFFPLPMLMDRLTDVFWQEPLRTVMFTDDIVICGESNEQVGDNLDGVKNIHVCE